MAVPLGNHARPNKGRLSYARLGSEPIVGQGISCDDPCVDRTPISWQYHDIRGLRYHRWMVIGFAGRKNGMTYWRCRCDCGEVHDVEGASLKRGHSTSCGCRQVELATEAATYHGMTAGGHRPPEYRSWEGMVARCCVEESKDFYRYGAIGITVCDRWRFGEGDETGFACFFADMGPRLRPNDSIDRFPNNKGNYELENCRWATALQQGRNRRDNVKITIDGREHVLAEFMDGTGISASAVTMRLKRGWSVQRAVSEPVKYRGQK